MSEFRVRPKEAREARETIRRFDEALAFHLDVLFPVEECKHDWKKGQRPKNTWGVTYTCSGCGEKVKPTGPKANYWITESEYEQRTKRLVEYVKGER